MTADSIYDRIIPAANGDCKLIAYPGSIDYPTYNMSISGLASAIACGLTSAINVNGRAIPVGGDSTGTPQTGSSPSNSTADQGGAFVAPPPATDFAPLDPKDYTCLSYQDASLCLPPGTYQKQSGQGFEIKNVDHLTFPGDAFKLTAHWEDAPQYRSPRPQSYTNDNYTTNQSPPSNSGDFYGFGADMGTIDQDRDGKATFIIDGPSTGPDPICCFFANTQYGGNAICLGVGGGNFPDPWQSVMQSLQCFNGGQVRLFAKEYGDSGESPGISKVDDLANQPYGNGNFAKAVKAVWIEKGQ